jgi:uncharacterized Fe-S cluster protein YjdI
MARNSSLARNHVTRSYSTEQITVHWNSALCTHSAECLNRLPEVFDVRRRPWVRVDSADADGIAAAVDACPSRALTYTRLDGAEHGPNGVPVEIGDRGPDPQEPGRAPLQDADGAPVVIALKPDGPLMIEGPVRIELARCEVLEVTDRAALCRCGGSENKPFCDGTHKKIGFTAEGW